VKRIAPLLTGIGVYLVSFAYLAWRTWNLTEGHLVYALDDAYIHMSISRTLASSGVFGVNPDGFTAASSSPMWTLLLAAVYLITGPAEWVPLVLNMLGSVALLWFAWHTFETRRAPQWLQYGVLVGIALFTPLALMTAIGMEHILHALAICVLVVWGSEVIERGHTPKTFAALLGLGFLAVSLRYESLAVVVLVAIFALVRRRWALAGALVVVGAMPIMAFGLYSLANGGFFLPNSIIVKAQWGEAIVGTPVEMLIARVGRAWKNFVSVPILVAGAVLLGAVSVRQIFRARAISQEVAVALITVGAILAQVSFGSVGWLFRYEAYLIPLLIMSVGLLARDRTLVALHWRELSPATARGLVAIAVVVVAALGVTRLYATTDQGAGFAGVMYTVNWQAARFIAENPQYKSVMLGDLGVMAWVNPDIHITDVEGLAESELPVSKLGPNNLLPEDYRRLADERDIDVAVLWFLPEWQLPDDWIAVGVMGHRYGGYLFGETGLGVCALGEDRVEQTLADFKEFIPSLPESSRYMNIEPQP